MTKQELSHLVRKHVHTGIRRDSVLRLLRVLCLLLVRELGWRGRGAHRDYSRENKNVLTERGWDGACDFL